MDVTFSASADEIELIYHEILQPVFPVDELYPLRVLMERLENGVLIIAVAREGGIIVGVAIAQRFLTSDVMLLEYLAVRPGGRSRGTGSRLVTAALDRWESEWAPKVIFAELEHPRLSDAEENRGDPQRRILFYQSLGARLLDVPYFLPPVDTGKNYVFGMLLTALRTRQDQLISVGEQAALAADLVRAFLVDYDEAFFKPVPVSAGAVTALSRALARDSISLLPLSRFDEIELWLPEIDE